MDALRDLLATDHRRALEFFVTGLGDVCEPGVDRQELLYNASVLAHFAQVSTCSQDDLPTPATLSVVFDNFVLGSEVARASQIMEAAGAQCLLLTGFFAEQMQGRHSIRWYAELGAGFFRRAATSASATNRARLLTAIGVGFGGWRQRYQMLSHQLREQAYLLDPPQSPPNLV